MKRQRDQVAIIVVCVGILRAVAAVGGHKRQRLVVHVGRDAHLRHSFDDLAALLLVRAGDADQIEVVRAVHVSGMVDHMGDPQLAAYAVINGHDLLTPREQLSVSVELAQTDRGHDVRHVALVPRADDIILPAAQL